MAGRGISGEFPEWGRVPIFCHSLELPKSKNGIRSRTGGSKFARLMKFAILRKWRVVRGGLSQLCGSQLVWGSPAETELYGFFELYGCSHSPLDDKIDVTTAEPPTQLFSFIYKATNKQLPQTHDPPASASWVLRLECAPPYLNFPFLTEMTNGYSKK